MCFVKRTKQGEKQKKNLAKNTIGQNNEKKKSLLWSVFEGVAVERLRRILYFQRFLYYNKILVSVHEEMTLVQR